MPRTCTLCVHPDRAAIDAALLEGGAYRDVAGQWGVSKSAVERHKRDHLATAIVKARDSAEAAHGDNLLAKVGKLSKHAESMYAEAERILRRALRDRDHDTALEAIRTAAGTMREAAALRAAGESLRGRRRHDEPGRADLLRDQVFDVIMRHVPEADRKTAIAADLQALRVRTFSREIPS